MNAKSTMIVRQTKFLVFGVLILALSALSFFETIDQLAHKNVSETTLETIGILAILAAIDASISVLQSLEIGGGVGVELNIELGQALDPLNTMVEHLSKVVAWAIGSLFLQQAVLQIVANDFFKFVFLTFGLITFLTLSVYSSQNCQTYICRVFGISKNSMDLVCTWVLKLFFTTAVVRFVVPTFMLCSFLFSEALVQSDLNTYKANIMEFSNEHQFDTDVSISSPSELAEQEQSIKAELSTLQSQLPSHQLDFDVVEENLNVLNGKIFLRKLIPGDNFSNSYDPEVDEFIVQRQDVRQKIENTKARIADLERDLRCIGRQKEGKNCDSLLDRLELTEAVSRTKEVGSRILEMVNDEIQKGTDASIPPQSVLVEREQVKQSELNALQSELSNYQLELDAVDSKFSDLNKKLKTQRQEVQRKIGISKERISDLEDDLECIGRQKEGENCMSIWDRINQSKELITQKFASMKALASDMIDSIIRLLIIVFVKNILFPLIFAYLAMKSSIPILRKVMDLKTDFQKTAKDVSTELQR